MSFGHCPYSLNLFIVHPLVLSESHFFSDKGVDECFQRYNTRGDHFGNCGSNGRNFVPCPSRFAGYRFVVALTDYLPILNNQDTITN